MDVAAVHAQLLSQQIFQAGGIQHRAGAEHLSGRKSGQPPGGVGEHIHRIGYHQKDALKSTAGELGQDAPENGGVPPDEIQAGLARFLAGSGSEDDHGAVGCIVIGPGINLHGGGVWEAVAQVHGFPRGLLPVRVDEYQLGV